jgi:methionine sulfoxide reductase heme-binding subunit
MRLSGRTLAVLGGALGIVVVVATDQIVPATSQYQAQMRLWLAARAAGLTAYLLLTVLVSLGLILSHPVNQSTWRLSKRLFPWHENLFMFVVAFLVAHIVSLVLDPYAGVWVGGALIPGLSSYRSTPVALGTLGLYALLITGLTARYTKRLPTGWWLRIHRVSLLAWALAWGHSILAGTDADAWRWVYVSTGVSVVLAAAYRYWVAKKRRPTFATSLPGANESSHAPVPNAVEAAAGVATAVPPGAGTDAGSAPPSPQTVATGIALLRPTPGARPGGRIAVPTSIDAVASEGHREEAVR